MQYETANANARYDGTYRRVIWRVLPFLMFCDMFSVIDRFNIGFAKLQFMQDLSLNEATVGVVAGAFYVGFTIFEIPSTLLLQRYGIRKTLLRIMGVWGLVTIALAFANSKYQLYALRSIAQAQPRINCVQLNASLS
jgi:MFS family permease